MLNNGNLTVNINTAVFFKAVLVGLLFMVLYMLRDLVLILLTSVVFASSIEPMTRWFIKFRIPRVVAVIFIFLSLAIILIGIFYLFLPPVLSEVSGALALIPQYLESLTIFGSPQFGSQFFGEQFSQEFSIQNAITETRNAIAHISSGLFESISTLFHFI
jgi:predicted PurR-regulated permease PerM